MLLTDDSYHRAYGVDNVIYYIIFRPGLASWFVGGFNDDTYYLAYESRAYRDESTLLIKGYRRMPITPRLTQETDRLYRRHYVTE